MSLTAARPIVLMATDGPSSRIVYHTLAREFGSIKVILEERPSRLQMVRRRIKTLGPITVAGQVLFQATIPPLLKRVGARRIAAIKRDHGLDDSPIDVPVRQVGSANSVKARKALRELDPRVVVINGTRILSAATLKTTAAPFINLHAGITPLYRGVHGGYWALAEGCPQLVGSTVHLVDHGIDTGKVLAQATFAISDEDSFVTYPYLHVAAGLPILIDAVRHALAGDLAPVDNPRNLPSMLRSHPTIFGYLTRRIRRGIR
jgi:phosphoribosylglycinamide formyltransferase 1